MRNATLTATTLVLVTAGDAAAKTPQAVTKAATSVEIVRSNTGQGSAVRVGPKGGSVTSTVLVSRTSEIALTGADKRSTPADRAESDAPTGLVLLNRRGTAAAAGLTPAPGRAKRGQTVYLISRPLGKNATTATITATRVRSSTRESLGLTAKNRSGLNGGAVVDAQGRLLGITVPPLPGSGLGSPQRAIPVSATPVPQSSAVATTSSGFPAVPVTIGLGVLLLASHLLLLRRRRVAATAPAVAPLPTPQAPAAPAATASATADPADDFEITLRPRG
ncbi:MAG: trypsin-like peptidase domain-containing protein [Solirubrobacteraceae bacterium]|nr:trypsin-like peptidase domain-containing protein [Solirubrobacteraceae bacterium]